MVKLSLKEIKDYLSQLKEGWEFVESDPSSPEATTRQWKILKEYKFEDFARAMEFVNKIVPVAEEAGHHPDITIHYNKVQIVLWSHFIKGLSENDFIMAAKIDAIT